MSCTRDDLAGFQPRHTAFVGIDSDGCVFDTMELKQKQCFHPLIISHWRLEPVAPYVREAAEFVNLYSRWRGQNRLLSLLQTFDFLRERPEVRQAAVTVPRLESLRRLADSGVTLGNPALEQALAQEHDDELASVLDWSRQVNRAVEEKAGGVRVFEGVRESLETIGGDADAICISQTPAEALVREWQEHGLRPYVSMIAGQELGTKQEHIDLAADGKYAPDRILVIGDAPGDLATARHAGALFYPVNPGREEASWKRFKEEAWSRFLAGRYRGEYQDALIDEFDALLPETPPWLECGTRNAECGTI